MRDVGAPTEPTSGATYAEAMIVAPFPVVPALDAGALLVSILVLAAALIFVTRYVLEDAL